MYPENSGLLIYRVNHNRSGNYYGDSSDTKGEVYVYRPASPGTIQNALYNDFYSTNGTPRTAFNNSTSIHTRPFLEDNSLIPLNISNIVVNPGGGSVTFNVLDLPAQFTPYIVTSSSNSGVGSLRNIISTATGNNPVITFAPGITSITLNETIEINKKINIIGGETGVTISGGNVTRMFNVQNGGHLIIENLRLINGSGASGGAIYIQNYGTLVANKSTFSNNQAT